VWGRRAGTVGGGRRAGEVLLRAGTVVERRRRAGVRRRGDEGVGEVLLRARERARNSVRD